MSFVSSKELMLKAQSGHYGVPAFNVENMEFVQAVIKAAEEMNSPVILQTTPSSIKYCSPEMFSAMVAARAKTATVPVALHLDHGNSYELAMKCAQAGYTTVMIDGSALPFEENVALAKRVKEDAEKFGIPVEAELGAIGGKEDSLSVSDKDALYTNPAQAKEFVERTGIDSLAVAIGTAHGFYKQTPKLDFERLAQIRELVDIPLVLHGTSGVADEDVQKAVSLGICKVNFATALRDAFTKGVRAALASDEKMYDPKKYLAKGSEAVTELAKKLIVLMGSDNKA